MQILKCSIFFSPCTCHFHHALLYAHFKNLCATLNTSTPQQPAAMYNAERTIGGASFPFQLLLLVSLGWSVVWLLLTFSFLIFKATVVPFPPAALPMEIIAAFIVLAVDIIGVMLGMRGNLTETPGTISISLALLAIAAVGAIYYMWLQTYVMMLDLAFSAAFLGINGLTILGGVWAIYQVSRGSRASYLNIVTNAEKKKN